MTVGLWAVVVGPGLWWLALGLGGCDGVVPYVIVLMLFLNSSHT